MSKVQSCFHSRELFLEASSMIDKKIPRYVQQLFIEYVATLYDEDQFNPHEVGVAFLFLYITNTTWEEWNQTWGYKGFRELALRFQPILETFTATLDNEDIEISYKHAKSLRIAPNFFYLYLTEFIILTEPSWIVWLLFNGKKQVMWISQLYPANWGKDTVFAGVYPDLQSEYGTEIASDFSEGVVSTKGLEPLIQKHFNGLPDLVKTFPILLDYKWDTSNSDGGCLNSVLKVCCKLYNLTLRGSNYCVGNLNGNIELWDKFLEPKKKKRAAPKPRKKPTPRASKSNTKTPQSENKTQSSRRGRLKKMSKIVYEELLCADEETAPALTGKGKSCNNDDVTICSSDMNISSDEDYIPLEPRCTTYKKSSLAMDPNTEVICIDDSPGRPMSPLSPINTFYVKKESHCDETMEDCPDEDTVNIDIPEDAEAFAPPQVFEPPDIASLEAPTIFRQRLIEGNIEYETSYDNGKTFSWISESSILFKDGTTSITLPLRS